MFVMFSGGFWSSFKVRLTLIAPSVNMCPQTPMERFYLCIKSFYFLFFSLFTQNGAWVRPILGPCGKDVAAVATLPDCFLKISPEIFITDPSSQFKRHSYLPKSGIRLTSYSGLSHTVPFLCVSLPPSLFMVSPLAWEEPAKFPASRNFLLPRAFLGIWLSLHCFWPHFLPPCHHCSLFLLQLSSLFLEHARLTCLRALAHAVPSAGISSPSNCCMAPFLTSYGSLPKYHLIFLKGNTFASPASLPHPLTLLLRLPIPYNILYNCLFIFYFSH